MGRKNKGSSKSKEIVPSTTSLPHKLSPLKRNEVNQLVEKILKVSSGLQQGASSAKEWDTYMELHKLLQKVMEAEADLREPVGERKITELWNWLKENDAVTDDVSVDKFEGFELGMRADKDFDEGDMMLAVPRKIMLSIETACDSELSTLLAKDPMLQHMPNVALSLMLLLEKFKPDSFWAPYIASLPTSYTTVLFFSPDEITQLKGSPTMEAALKQCRNIARQYAYFNKVFQRSNDAASQILRDFFSYEQYRWAVSTVMTRQNFVPSSDNSGVINALIPLWDMCNHTEGKLSTDFVAERDRCECMAWRPFKQGEQIFIYYGTRPNCELFLHNGFVMSNNPNDTLAIRLGVSKADPLNEKKVSLLARLGLPSSGEFLLLAGAEPVHPALLSFLRIFSMNAEHLDNWLSRDNCRDLEHIDCALDTELESRVWEFLKTRLAILLRCYPTTLQDDEELVKTKLSPCKQLAILQRISEKQLLNSAIEYTQQRVKP